MTQAYTVTTNFGAKDSLASGNPAKLILGAQFTTEFTNLFNALAALTVANPPTWKSNTGTLFNITDGTDQFQVSNVAGNVSVGTSSNSILTFVTNGSARGAISATGAWTMLNGLAVSGGVFSSRGITDNATATAFTLAAGGAATLNAGLTVSGGAFASRGFTDNATANCFTLANGGGATFTGAVVFTSTTVPTLNDGLGTQFNAGFKEAPFHSVSGAYTPVLADSGKTLDCVASTAVTLPLNASVAYPIGTVITILGDFGSGSMTVAAGAGDTLYLAGNIGTTGTRTIAPLGLATVLRLSTTQWVIAGSGVT